MATDSDQRSADADEPVSLRSFFLAAVLWLPLAFFLWYVLRGLVVFAPIKLAAAWLGAWMPEVVTGVQQDFADMLVTTIANLSGVDGLPQPRLETPFAIEVLPYCYGLPVLIGLVMATPLDWTRTFVQLAIGIVVLLPIQAFGLVGGVLKVLAFDYGSLVATGVADVGFAAVAQQAGQAAVLASNAALVANGIGPGPIGLWYQFGSLILPAITPVVTWILLNRRFIEQLVAPDSKEPRPPGGGQNSAT